MTVKKNHGFTIFTVIFILVVLGMGVAYLLKIASMHRTIVNLRQYEARAHLETLKNLEWFLGSIKYYSGNLDPQREPDNSNNIYTACRRTLDRTEQPCQSEPHLKTFPAEARFNADISGHLNCIVQEYPTSNQITEYLYDVYAYAYYGDPESDQFIARCTKIQVPVRIDRTNSADVQIRIGE